MLGPGVAIGDRVDLGLRDTGALADLDPIQRRKCVSNSGQPWQYSRRKASSAAPISTIRLAMPVSRARSPPISGCTYRLAISLPKSMLRIAGDAKIHHADFAHGIDHDHLPAAAADMHQGRHQARMIAGRITADDEHQVRMLEILQLHGRGAGAERVGQADAAGLVT